MRTSRASEYALLAAGYIAINTQKVVLSQAISKEYDIPLEYLLKILQQLVRANILRSKRGPQGGFSLAKEAKKISMLDIIEAVEGSAGGQLYLSELAPKEKFGARMDAAYKEAIDKAKSILEKTTLAEMVGIGA